MLVGGRQWLVLLFVCLPVQPPTGVQWEADKCAQRVPVAVVPRVSNGSSWWRRRGGTRGVSDGGVW